MKYILMLLILGGCATIEPKIKTVEITVPVYVKCETAVASKPLYASKKIKPDSNIWLQSQSLRLEIEERTNREKLLEEALQSCK